MSDFILKGKQIHRLISEKNKSPFAGVGVAVVTPFDKNNKIDKEAIYKLSDQFYYQGVSYVVVQGTTGESSVLNPDEKNEVNSIFIDAFKGRLPLVLGISSNDTRHLCDLISKADLTGFEAIMSVCPYYNKPSQEGIFQHFKSVCDISPLPLILYNVPGRTSVDMSNETIVRLSEYSSKIIGVKEASGDVLRIKELKEMIDREFLVISGDDFTMLEAFNNGADGIISVAGNLYSDAIFCIYISVIWAYDQEGFKKLCNQLEISHYKIGNGEDGSCTIWDLRPDLLRKLKEFTDLIFDEGNPSGIKYALQCKNLCNEKVRLPLTSISYHLKIKIANFVKKNIYDNYW